MLVLLWLMLAACHSEDIKQGMHQAFDPCRIALQRLKSAFVSSVAPDRVRGLPNGKVATILAHWGVEKFTIKKDLGGKDDSNWLIDTALGPLVLRRVEGEADWVTLVIRVMDYLANSDFPYATPHLIRRKEGAPSFFDGRDHWLLCRFVEGVTALNPSNTKWAGFIGDMVGHFARVLADFDLGDQRGCSPIILFERDRLAELLSDYRRWLREDSERRALAAAFDGQFDAVVRAHARISEDQIRRIHSLDRRVVFVDWHRHNLIAQAGQITGLIDFDSVQEAPKILDFQSALIHILLSKRRVDPALIRAFAAAYGKVDTLAPEEVSLLPALMMDRVIFMIYHLLERVQLEASRREEVLAARSLNLFTWLDGNGEALAADLADLVIRR